MSSTTRGAASLAVKAGTAASLAILGLITPAHANPANPANPPPRHPHRPRPPSTCPRAGIVNFGCDGWSQNGQAFVYAKGTPIQNYLERKYSVDEGWSETRAYTAFTTRLAGRQVRVFNTQLSWGPYHEARGQQAKELANVTRRYGPALVAGDLNAKPSDREMGPLWQAGFSDVDPFCRQQADRRCNYTQVGAQKKFDYILYRGVNSRNCILRTVNEDHRVVISDVTRAQGPRVRCSVT